MCPGAPTQAAYRLRFVNAGTTQPVELAFGQADCSDWMGRTPLAYSPITVSNNGSAGMRIDPACDPAPFTATLSVPGGPDPAQVASLRLLVANGLCKTDSNRLSIFKDGAWAPNTGMTVSAGGTSWTVSVSTSGGNQGTVTVTPS